MKTKLNVLTLLFTVLFFSACSTFTYTSRVAEIQIENNINITPSVVDVKIDFTKKITAISEKQNSPSAAREQAYYKAIKDNNIDVLISPIYEMESETSGKNSKVTVTGYAGYFVNSRTLTEEKKLAFDAKLDALSKMLKLDPIVKEEQKTVLLSGGAESKGATTISTSSPSLIEKFVILYDNNTMPSKSNNAPTINNNNLGGIVNKLFAK